MIQREFIVNAFYHIYNRGNQRRKTFLNKNDYYAFLGLIFLYAKKYKITVFAYCLIPNHFHMIIKQSDKLSMTKFMHGLGTSYSMYFNREHNKVGHVFQGPYRAILIKNLNSLFNEIDYVLNNPVKHGYINTGKRYRWVKAWPSEPI